jgi:hypothetical protein
MNRRIVHVLAMLTIAVGFTSVAQADNYGPLADAYKCEKEVDAVANEGGASQWSAAARKSGKGLSAECKAEIEKRIPACEKDPWMKRELTDPELNKGDPKGLCFDKAFSNVWEQIINDRNSKKQAQEEAKTKEEAKAKGAAELAAVELPKPQMHDGSLEKAVSDAYHRYDPPAKVIKVVLGKWADELEKDALGRVTGRDIYATVVNKQPDGKCLLHGEYYMQHGNGRSFSGPLSARGAGSASDKEILCEKIGAGASKGGTKKQK